MIFRAANIKLGTSAKDINGLYKACNNICNQIRIKGLEEVRETNIKQNLQPFDIPEIDKNLIDTKIEMLWKFTESNKTIKLYWCFGTVIAFKCNGKLEVEWDDKTPNTQEE